MVAGAVSGGEARGRGEAIMQSFDCHIKKLRLYPLSKSFKQRDDRVRFLFLDPSDGSEKDWLEGNKAEVEKIG